MAWGTSHEHASKDGDQDPRGATHSDIQFRDDLTGKVDQSAGKGYISGPSSTTNYLDSLSDPANPGSSIPRN
jgi:hypothetical protein